MITLNSYINENKRNTTSNKERLEELEKYLKNKSYPEYVKTLNKMLEDPKAKLLLQDGFGGTLGDMEFKFSVKRIKATSLLPTQAEIDCTKSIQHSLINFNNIHKCFNNPVIINNIPVVTFRGNYVIDGHHRWAEACMINPDCKLLCFDYDADISPIQMLKAVQGVIANVVSNDERNVPSDITKGENIFNRKWTKTKIEEWIKNTISDKSKKVFKSYNITVDDLVHNILNIKYNNYPPSNSPNRGEMPQTDKASKNINDKQHCSPDDSGSALNILKNKKVAKSVL